MALQNKQRKILPLLLLLFFEVTMTAQTGSTDRWKEKLGGNGKDRSHRIIQNKQGQFVVVGETGGWLKDKDMAFTIVDSTGTASRTYSFGGNGHEGANSIVQTQDGGYAIAGFTESKDFVKYGKRDAWLVKVDETGRWMWDLPVGTKEDDAFKDIVEAENGDLWLTGQSDDKLWVVKVDARGKKAKTTVLPTNGDSKSSGGNALAWSWDKRVLYVVGYKVLTYGKQASRLLLVPFDTEGTQNFTTEKTLENTDAEAMGIVRDRLGNFGIVGNEYSAGKSHTKTLFCYYDANAGRFSTPSLFNTAKQDDAEGLAIAEDLDGQFIIAGKSFKKLPEDVKRQGWLQKVDADGKKVWDKPIWGGGNFENAFAAAVVSERGVPIVVSNVSDVKMNTNVVAINRQTVVVNPKKPVLNIVPNRFHDEEDNPFLSRNHRGFYKFWIENRDTADVFDILATVRPQKEKFKQLLGDFERIHIGTLRKGEKRLITVPFEADNTLQRDSCFVDIDFSTPNGPLSINHSFLLRTIDVLKHKLELVSASFPEDIRAGETYTFSFSLKNTGELAATNVQINLQPQQGTRITILNKKESFRTEDIEVGETRFFEAAFEVQKEFYIDVVLLNIFAKVKAETQGTPFTLQNNMKPEPKKAIVQDTIRFKWQKPAYEDIKEDNIVYAFQDKSAFLPDYSFEAIVESNKPILKENVRLFIDGDVYESHAKMDNVSVKKLDAANGYPHRFKMSGNISLHKEETQIQIKVKNTAKPSESEVLKLVNKNIPNLYVLAVGVSYDENENVAEKLQCTKADADSICAVLKRQEGLFFKNVKVISLTSETETKGQTIKNAIADMGKKITETDVFVLFLSGHGFIRKNAANNVVFQAYDYDRLNPTTYLDYKTEIEEPIKALKGQKLIFIDACQSYKNEPTKNTSEPDTQLGSAWASLVSGGPSYRALLSCGKGQSSYEDPNKLKHGVFTYALLEAMKEDNSSKIRANVGVAGENPDKFLTFKELANFTVKRVPQLCRQLEEAAKKRGKIRKYNQNPLIVDDAQQDVPIFMLQKQ